MAGGPQTYRPSPPGQIPDLCPGRRRHPAGAFGHDRPPAAGARRPAPPPWTTSIWFFIWKAAWNWSTRTSGASARCWSSRRGWSRPPWPRWGRSPFPPKLTAAWLAEQARGRSRPIKNFCWTAAFWPASATFTPAKSSSAARLHPATPAGAPFPEGLGPYP